MKFVNIFFLLLLLSTFQPVSYAEIELNSEKKANNSFIVAELKDAPDAVQIDNNLLKESALPWWGWALLLFIVCFLLGIIAVLGGVGGGVLFVPIVGSFFPFHMDFVRATGLLLALSGALSSTPSLLRSGMINLRLGMPLALVASISSILGAYVGLMLPVNIVQIALGLTILCIVVVMFTSKKSEFPDVEKSDLIAEAFQMNGIYYDQSIGREIQWKVHRTPLGLVLFFLIGILAGMFGLGAGWANVPVLNQVMGAPLKVSVSSSAFILSVADTTAAWVYINKGAMVPMIVTPSLIGIMLGAKIGVRLLKKTKPEHIKKVVILILIIASLRSLLKGFKIWN